MWARAAEEEEEGGNGGPMPALECEWEGGWMHECVS